MKIIMTVTVVVIILLIGLNTMRSFDELRSYLAWQKIEKSQPQTTEYFSSHLVKDLPDPARRYFEYSLGEGTPIKRRVQTIDITINETGQPIKITIPHWSDSNPQNTYQLQPFGGYLSAFKEFEGYRLPTHVC